MAVFGKDIRIHKTAVLKQKSVINFGNHISIDMGVYISTYADIGSYVHIAPYVCVIGGSAGYLRMEDFTNISTGCNIIIISDDFKYGMINPIVPIKYRHLIGSEFIMKRFSVIGAGSTVLPNVIMAEGSALGANSLLTKSTEPWTVYAGSPAKPIGVRDKEFIYKSAKELGYDI
jgi:galactoside O-acetyltransferase